MYVYRLERGGYGVFMNGPYPKREAALHNEFNCTVGINWSDGNEWRFACDSIDQLIEYFGPSFSELLADDTVDLVEYNVHKAHVRLGAEVSTDQLTWKYIEVAFKATRIKSRKVL